MRGRALIAIAILVASACGGGSSSGSGPTLPTAPSSTTPPALAELTGTWKGIINDGRSAFGLRWTATQNGTTVTGALLLGDIAVIDVGDVRDDPRNGVGTMTGTLSGSGNQINLTWDFPARTANQGPGGAFGGVGMPNCAMTASGSGNASARVISGTMTLNWTAQCGGGGPTAIRSGQISLSK